MKLSTASANLTSTLLTPRTAMGRTNNFCESFNRSFHPKRKKEYVEKDNAIRNMVASYDSYEDNIFEYLDELADL